MFVAYLLYQHLLRGRFWYQNYAVLIRQVGKCASSIFRNILYKMNCIFTLKFWQNSEAKPSGPETCFEEYTYTYAYIYMYIFQVLFR